MNLEKIIIKHKLSPEQIEQFYKSVAIHKKLTSDILKDINKKGWHVTYFYRKWRSYDYDYLAEQVKKNFKADEVLNSMINECEAYEKKEIILNYLKKYNKYN